MKYWFSTEYSEFNLPRHDKANVIKSKSINGCEVNAIYKDIIISFICIASKSDLKNRFLMKNFQCEHFFLRTMKSFL